MRKLLWIFSGVLTIFASNAAYADINHPKRYLSDIPKNSRAIVDFRFSHWHKDCKIFKGSNLRGIVIEKPKNGNVKVEWGQIRNIDGSKLRRYGRICDGKAIQGLKVIYQPNKNFVGSDRFRVRYRYNREFLKNQSKSQTYKIRVR